MGETTLHLVDPKYGSGIIGYRTLCLAGWHEARPLLTFCPSAVTCPGCLQQLAARPALPSVSSESTGPRSEGW
jgi:hypothetical protein